MNRLHFMTSIYSIIVFFFSVGVSNAAIIDIEADVSGWVQYNGKTNGRYANTTNYIAGRNEGGGDAFNNYFVFDLSGVEGRIKSATLKLENPDNGFYSFDNEYYNKSDYYTYSLRGVGIDANKLLPDNWDSVITGRDAFHYINSSSSTSFGEALVNEESNGTTVEIALNFDGITDLSSLFESDGFDGYYAIGGKLITPNARETYVFGDSGGGGYSRTLSIETYDSIPVPEPTVISLFGLALVGLGFTRRKKSS